MAPEASEIYLLTSRQSGAQKRAENGSEDSSFSFPGSLGSKSAPRNFQKLPFELPPAWGPKVVSRSNHARVDAMAPTANIMSRSRWLSFVDVWCWLRGCSFKFCLLTSRGTTYAA